MVTDTSGSMLATDVRPNRLTAARDGGAHARQEAARQFRLGLVTFGTSPSRSWRRRPTAARSTPRSRAEGARLDRDGRRARARACRRAQADQRHRGRQRRLPAMIVLLSDGKKSAAATRSTSPTAPRAQGPDLHVALGTQPGTLEPRRRALPVPPDDVTLRDRRDDRRPLLRRAERGPAGSIYENLGTRFSTRREAGGHGRLRRRRARAAAGRRAPLAAADGEDPVSVVRRRRAACRSPPASRSRARAHARSPRARPVPPNVLRTLDLAVLRRVESLVPGEHLTSQVGGGTELAMIRPYRPGDDVRHIDWNVTARMHEPHVRVHVGERAMTAWLLLDVSAVDDVRDRRPPQGRRRRGRRSGDRPRRDAARQPPRRGRDRRRRAADHASAPGPPRPARAARRAAHRARGRRLRPHRSRRRGAQDRRARPRPRARRRRLRLPWRP